MIARALFVIALLAALASPNTIDAHDPIGSKVTWTGDIDRIFQARCVGCHRAGNGEAMPLTTYEDVQPWASAIRRQVLAREMPPWHAARGFGDFANDPSLSPFHIALIAAWANAGAPRGSENDVTAAKRVQDTLVDFKVPAQKTRDVSLTCGRQALSGRLLAVKPQLNAGGSATITALLPDGQREIVAWIRDYDPRYAITYWLRTPLALPRGSRVEVAATGDCGFIALLAR